MSRSFFLFCNSYIIQMDNLENIVGIIYKMENLHVGKFR